MAGIPNTGSVSADGSSRTTNPISTPGETPSIYNLGNFGLVGAVLGGLEQLTQENVTAILQGQVKFPSWLQVFNALWEGLDTLLSFPVAILKALLEKLIPQELFDILKLLINPVLEIAGWEDVQNMHQLLGVVDEFGGWIWKNIKFVITGFITDIDTAGTMLQQLVAQITKHSIDDLLEDPLGTLGDFFNGVSAAEGPLLTQLVKNTFPTLASALTGFGTADLPDLGIPAIQNWAKNLLSNSSDIPAERLIGQISAGAFATLPVSHINAITPNLLSQGGFSSSSTITAANGWSWDPDVNHSGTGGSAKVDCNGTLRELFSNQIITVVDGDKIDVSGYIKTSGFTGSGSSIVLSLIPFAGTTQKPPLTIATSGASNSSWIKLSKSAPWTVGTDPVDGGSVPTGVTSVRVRLAITSAATAGSVWFDDISVTKSGLLQQVLVEYLTDAWDNLIRGAFGIPANVAVDPKTVLEKITSLFSAMGSVASTASTGVSNSNTALGQLQTFLSKTPQQNFADLGTAVNNSINDIGSFLTSAGTGTAATVGSLVSGAITNATSAVSDLGTIINNVGSTITGGIVSTAAHVGQAIQGAIQGTIDTWNNFWVGVYGGSATGKTATDVKLAAGQLVRDTSLAQQTGDQAKAANVQTNLAVYQGYFGSGGSGVVAEVQAAMQSIKLKIDSGYTLQTLTFDSGTKKQDVAVFNVLNYSPTGTFTLACQGAVTAGIAASEASSTVQDKLQRLSTIGSGNATVSYSVISSSYPTQYNYQTVLAPLTQSVTVNGSPTGGTFQLTYNGQTTSALAYNASVADVQSAVNALSNTKSGSSLTLDGNGDYAVLPWSSNYDLSSGDWTIESFFKLTSAAGGVIVSNDTYGQSFDWYVYVNQTTAEMATNPGTFVRLTTTHPSLALNTWHHIAYVRQSGTVRCYINGIQRGTPISMTNTNLNRSNISIGCASWNNPSSYFPGKVSNLRVVKGTALYPNGTTFTPSTSPLTAVSGTVLLMFRGGAINDSVGNGHAYYGDAAISTDSPFSNSYTDVTVTGSPGAYSFQFAPYLPGRQMMTVTSSLTGGILPTVTVTDSTVYGKITGNVSGLTTTATGSAGDSLTYIASLPYWSRPFTTDAAPKQFYALAWGSGGGGQVGPRAVSNSSTTNIGGGTSYGAGGGAGSPGGFQAVEIDAESLPSEVAYRVAAGGNPNYSVSVLAGSGTPIYSAYSTPAESNFGSYLQTTVGIYTSVSLLGYFSSNQSAPGSGGVGGGSYQSLSGVNYRGLNGSSGVSTPLASGGGGGGGTQTRTTSPSASSTVGNGSAGSDLQITSASKSFTGGGGGGGGGGSFATWNGGWVNGVSLPGGLGGNGGRPGGGGGGGGSAYTYDVNSVGSGSITGGGIASGNGGYGGHGIIILLWK